MILELKDQTDDTGLFIFASLLLVGGLIYYSATRTSQPENPEIIGDKLIISDTPKPLGEGLSSNNLGSN